MEFSKSYTVLVLLVILSVVPKYNFTKYTTGNLIKDKEAKVKFEKLLTSIANVNKERIDALKRYNALENYNVARGIIRKNAETKFSTSPTISLNDYDLEDLEDTNDGLLYDINSNKPRLARKPGERGHIGLHNNYLDFDYASNDDIVEELREKMKLRGNRNVSHVSENLDEEADDEDKETYDDDGKETDDDDNEEANADEYDNYGVDIDDEENALEDDYDDSISNNSTNVGHTSDAIRNWGRGKLDCSGGRCSCITACKCAYKSFCSKFDCNKDTAVMFCKNCRLHCRSGFL